MSEKEPRYRCPKNGRWVSESNCMFCQNPPDNYEKCWEYNVVNPNDLMVKPIIPRWDNKGKDRRLLMTGVKK